MLPREHLTSNNTHVKSAQKTRMSRIDYSKWDQLDCSSDEEEYEGTRRLEEKEVDDFLATSWRRFENLSLSASLSSPLWNGLVLHHKDIFIAHVLSKLNRTDRYFFSEVNRESQDVLKYAGVDVSELVPCIDEYSSISTLEWAWNHMDWGEKDTKGRVMDQAWFCWQVAATNKLEFLEWAREEKDCEWNKWTITAAAAVGNLEMLKYCFSNDCACDEEESCTRAAAKGHLDCLRFLFGKVKPSPETEMEAAQHATCSGHMDILKYFVEERKISDEVKCHHVVGTARYGQLDCLKYLVEEALEERKISEQIKSASVYNAARYGQLDCIKYLVEEAKLPLNHWRYVACARHYEQPDCLNYLLEKGCPEPTKEEYAEFVEVRREVEKLRAEKPEVYDATEQQRGE